MKKKMIETEEMNYIAGICPKCGGKNIWWGSHKHTQTPGLHENHEPEEDVYIGTCQDCKCRIKEVRMVLFHHNEVTTTD